MNLGHDFHLRWVALIPAMFCILSAGCEKKAMTVTVLDSDVERRLTEHYLTPGKNAQQFTAGGCQIKIWTEGTMFRPASRVLLCGIIDCAKSGIERPIITIDIASDAVGGGPLPQLTVPELKRLDDGRFYFGIDDCLDSRPLLRGNRTLSAKLTIQSGPSITANLPFEVRNHDWSRP